MRLLSFLIMLLPLAGVIAQTKNCCHPPAFSIADLPSASPKPGHGNSHLPISASKDSAQYYLDQALNMFHSFNYHEAYMAANKALLKDDACLMCYVVQILVMENIEGDFEDIRKEVLNAAFDLYHDTSLHVLEHEAYLTKAFIEPYFVKKKLADTLTENNLRRLYESGLEQGAAFYLYHLGNTRGTDEHVSKLAETILSEHPKSTAVMHYYVHLFESEQPQRTRDLADRLIVDAPMSGHLQHMPGHIYYYNGLYEMAIEAFQKSFLIDSAYNNQFKYATGLNWNYSHNLHFLIVALVETGRYKQALDRQKELERASMMLQTTDPATIGLEAIQSKLYIPWRLNRWHQCLVACEMAKDLAAEGWISSYYLDGMRMFFEARNAFYLDKTDTFNILLKDFDKHITSVKKIAKEHGADAETANPEVEMFKICREILGFLSDHFSELGANFDADFRQLQYNVSQLRQPDPPIFAEDIFTVAAEILQNHRLYDEAIVYLQVGLKENPHNATGHLELARMAVKIKNTELVLRGIRAFDNQWINADSTLLEFEKARLIKSAIGR